jgi:glutamate synthase (NADPH/NADH) small chain
MYRNPQEIEAEAKEVLAKFGGKDLNARDKGHLPPMEMPTQKPEERIKNMHEVALGYTDDEVRAEALRCLDCKGKPCMQGCPVSIDIPAFVAAASRGEYEQSLAVLSESSLLPAICGRVCPQENQCQKFCTMGRIRGNVDESVAIGRIERYVADWCRENGKETLPVVAPSTGKKVAVVGSGPASISAAADLRKAGHEVVMFEALHKAGGVLVYGIPEFRLPKDIVAHEIDKLVKMGVEINLNYLVGRTRTLKQLKEEDGFDAIFIGSGAGLPKFMGIPGENAVGVFSANEYLTRANLMKAFDTADAFTPLYPAKHVAVFGGGNVAMDSARMARRLGAEQVDVIYRRTEVEMPARKEEVAHAKEEGINFLFLHAPLSIEYTADKFEKVTGVKLITCKLGEPDASGRRSPVEIPGTEKVYPYDAVIVAIGNSSNPLIKNTTKEIETNKRGNFIVNEETCETSIPGVYAGGDIVLGAATVILAMGQGRKAAKAMNAYLK